MCVYIYTYVLCMCVCVGGLIWSFFLLGHFGLSGIRCDLLFSFIFGRACLCEWCMVGYKFKNKHHENYVLKKIGVHI